MRDIALRKRDPERGDESIKEWDTSEKWGENEVLLGSIEFFQTLGSIELSENEEWGEDRIGMTVILGAVHKIRSWCTFPIRFFKLLNHYFNINHFLWRPLIFWCSNIMICRKPCMHVYCIS